MLADQPADGLTEPAAGDLRLLPPSALALWKVLVRERDRCASAGDWFKADLRVLASRARLGSYSTAVRALASLRNAGLVPTERHIVMRRIGGDYRRSQERNWYFVAGSYSRRSGIDKIRFPREAWEDFVQQCRAGIRRDLIRIKGLAPRLYEETNWRPEWSLEIRHGLFIRSLSLSAKSALCISPKKEIGSSFSTSYLKEDVRFADFSSPPPEDLAASDAWCDLVESKPPPRPILIPKPGPCPWKPIDKPLPPQHPVFVVLEHTDPDHHVVHVCLEAYRQAVRKVYGIKWWGWSKGLKPGMKHYDRWLACGRMIAEHAMVPEHWAIWRLTWFKENTEKFASKPPPPLIIMSAKSVSKMRGHFKKDFERPIATQKLDHLVLEQTHRNEEAQRIHSGEPNRFSMTMHAAYVEMRRQEILFGYDDPLALYPTRKGTT